MLNNTISLHHPSILTTIPSPNPMCKSVDHLHQSPYYTHDGGDVLTIKALFVHVRPSASSLNKDPLAQFLTLLFHPPNPSLSLHRLLNHPLPHAIFAAKLRLTLRLRPSQHPLSFQLFLGEASLLKGAFIKQDHHHWTLDCQSQLHHLQSHSLPISEVQLCFAFDDGNLAVTDWVRLRNPWERLKHCVNGCHLEQIPEEMEDPLEDSHELMDLERPRWTVDLGIWVLCLGLGVGYLVSRASKKFRPF